MPMNRSILLTSLCALAVAVSGCSQSGSTAALDTASQQTETAAVETADTEADGSTVRREASTVAQKGSFIRVLVNGDPITNFDVQRRAKFRQLRRLNPAVAETQKELIDERIKMHEAKARGMVAGDAQVNAAFANFAKSNKSTPAKIGGDLDRIGVGQKHFKEFIRAQISWSRLVAAKAQATGGSQTSQADALFTIRKSGGQKPETTEYLLQQIVFVVPQDKRSSLMKARRAEALAFSQRYTGCATAIELAKGLRDVTVRDLGRVMKPELPPEWSEQILATETGKTTTPRESERGVELIGICRSNVVSDDRAAQVVTQAQAYEELETKGDKGSDDYLAELKKSAVIVYR